MSELKKCPFCGGEAEIVSTPEYFGGEFERLLYKPWCTKCKVELNAYFYTPEGAAEAWNHRADHWHKWPEERPAEIGDHLIIYGSADCFDTLSAYWDGKKWYQYASYHAYRLERVLAWREMPEPWEGKRE